MHFSLSLSFSRPSIFLRAYESNDSAFVHSRDIRDAQNAKRIHYALSLSGIAFFGELFYFFFFGTEGKKEFNHVDEEERKRTMRSLTMTAAAAATRTVEIFEKGADSYCEGVTRISHGSGKR